MGFQRSLALAVVYSKANVAAYARTEKQKFLSDKW